MKTSIYSDELFPIIKNELEEGKTVSFTVSGTSMRPFLKDKKSQVSIKKASSYKKYDIILYENHAKKMVLHRIVKGENPFTVYGDALRVKELVYMNQIVGKVISIKTADKTKNPNHWFYQLKVKLWILLRPFRRLLLKLIRK
ncbi:MAG: S24/S26 family peptidase [Candidatus Izemoplasmataceae bacterium]